MSTVTDDRQGAPANATPSVAGAGVVRLDARELGPVSAIGFRRYGPPEVLQPLAATLPPPGPGEILVRVAAAGVNPADWNLRQGRFRRVLRLRLPFVPGCDLAGVVAAVGDGVRHLRPGDAIYAMQPAAVGGGYAEYAIVSAEHAAPVPAGITLAEAAATPLAALTALQALRDGAGIQPGAALLIHGASGGVGTFAIQIAGMLGARVTAVCSERNGPLARELGAAAVLDYTRDDPAAGGPRYDAIFDTVGDVPFRRWRRALRPGGVMVTIAPTPATFVLQGLTRIWPGPRLRAIFVRPSGTDLASLADWLATGRVRPVLDRRYPLAEATEAHRYSETRRARGKLVLVVDERLADTRVAAPTP